MEHKKFELLVYTMRMQRAIFAFQTRCCLKEFYKVQKVAALFMLAEHHWHGHYYIKLRLNYSQPILSPVLQ